MHSKACPSRSNVVFWFSYKAASKWIDEMYNQCTNLKSWEHYTEVNQNNPGVVVENPTNVLFVRNPYKRIVSGFIFCYAFSNFHRRVTNQEHWKVLDYWDSLTFETFINVIHDSANWEDAVRKGINREHIQPQHIGKPVNIIFDKVMDIENIDYSYINSIFNSDLNWNELRKRNNSTRYGEYKGNKPAYKLNLLDLFLMEGKPDYKLFFNDDIKLKFEQFFKKDFELLKKHGFSYKI